MVERSPQNTFLTMNHLDNEDEESALWCDEITRDIDERVVRGPIRPPDEDEDMVDWAGL